MFRVVLVFVFVALLALFGGMAALSASHSIAKHNAAIAAF